MSIIMKILMHIFDEDNRATIQNQVTAQYSKSVEK